MPPPPFFSTPWGLLMLTFQVRILRFELENGDKGPQQCPLVLRTSLRNAMEKGENSLEPE